MEQHTPSQPAIENVGLSFVLLCVVAAILALSVDLIFFTVKILFDPGFLSGFGLLMVQVVVVSAAGGPIGITLAELVLRSEWITQSTIRFLRLGMWLPFFIAWASPMWWIRWGETIHVTIWGEQVLRVVIPTFPTVMFAACYYHLSARYTLELHPRAAFFMIVRPIVSHAFFFSFLAQVNHERPGWQWFTGFFDPEWMARPTATVLLVAGFLLILPFRSNSGFEKTADMTAVATVRPLRESNWGVFLGAGILWLLCFAVWNAFYVFLRDVFMIAPFRQVIRAAYRLLTTGSMMANMESTLWSDIAVSAQEIGEGLMLSGVLAFVAVKGVQAAASTIRLSWVFIFTHSLPIVLAIMLTPWIGIGHWLKALIVAAASFFPFAQTLWGLRSAPPVSRILLALDNALPYAFVGMLFGELWAATAGLGFFIVIARANGNRTEALATSLITLGLMVSVSFVLRLIVKRLYTFETELAQVDKSK